MRDGGEFYVGYLKAPRGLTRFLRGCVPVLIAGALVLAWNLSRAQNDPGNGVWHDQQQTLTGRISATPYPLIRVASSRPAAPVESILLVSEGKHGGGSRVTSLHGRIVQARGTILERDGHRLMELADGDALRPDDARSAAPASAVAGPGAEPRRAILGRVTLQGEIIDPKCYSGAMKPGEGKAHKECATLCIAGGIPPMFVSLDAAGRRQYYLLVDSAGRALQGRTLHERLLPFVADAVEISGELESCDDLTLLRIDPASIRRL